MKGKSLVRDDSNQSYNISFNQSFNMSINSSYQDFLCKAIKDINEDNNMFSYLHREMGKIKTPSQFDMNLNKSVIVDNNHNHTGFYKEPARNDYFKSKRKKNINFNIAKKHFLFNDDDNDYPLNMYNTKLLEGMNSYENISKMMLMKRGKYKEGFMSKKNDLLQKTNGNINNILQLKGHQSKMRMDLRVLINENIFNHKMLFIRALERSAIKYYHYEKLCYMLKVTFMHKYIYRMTLVKKIIKQWKAYSKIINAINNKTFSK